MLCLIERATCDGTAKLSIRDKQGSMLRAKVSEQTEGSGFGDQCPGFNQGSADRKVFREKIIRWLVVAIDVNRIPNFKAPIEQSLKSTPAGRIIRETAERDIEVADDKS